MKYDRIWSKYRILKKEKERERLKTGEKILSSNIFLSSSLVPAYSHSEDTAQVAIKIFADTLRSSVRGESIAMDDRIEKPPAPETPGKRMIMVRFHRKADKSHIITANFTIRAKGLYINEELTKYVNELHYRMRKVKEEQQGKYIYSLHKGWRYLDLEFQEKYFLPYPNR